MKFKNISAFFSLSRSLFFLLFIVELLCFTYYVELRSLFSQAFMWNTLLVYFLLVFSLYGRVELAIFASIPSFMLYYFLPSLLVLFDIPLSYLFELPNLIVYVLSLFQGLFIVSILRWNYIRANLSGIRFKLLRIPVVNFIAITSLYAFSEGQELLLLLLLGLNLSFLAALFEVYLFEHFISKPSKAGNQPYNLIGLIRSILPVSMLLITSILLQFYVLFLWALPFNRIKARRRFRRGIRLASRTVIFCMIGVKRKVRNELNEELNKPSIIIANHQSLVDLLQMMSLTSDVVVVSKDWVWRSPVFSFILSFAGYLNAQDGYDSLEEGVKQSIAEGCSVLVFPEGQRTVDCEIKRFHRGAFALAEKMKLDILPIVMYGNGYTSSKKQGLHIKKGVLVLDVLKRIKADDLSFGENYRKRARFLRQHLMEHYEKIRLEFDRPANPYFYDAVQKNYTYKDAILERYMRLQLRLERNYQLYDDLIPRDASIVDVGCGYGSLSFMLSLYAKKRSVLGIDSNAKKINLAKNSYMASDKVNFECLDVLNADMPASDAFIVKDLLCCMPSKEQFNLLRKLKEALNERGVIVVHEGDTEHPKHQRTITAQTWSTRLLTPLAPSIEFCYPSTSLMKSWANRLNCKLEIGRSGKANSNTVYVFRPVKNNS